jgi:hypothetical protein
MSVLKIKKNGVWESVSGVSGHTHTISDITDFPEDFTISGGDADTVDGKHASDFAAANHTHEQIDILTNLVGDTDVSTQIADAIADMAEKNHTHDNATDTTSGFMSSTDKKKLNGIEDGANLVNVVDNLQSTLTSAALSAYQGKVLKDTIDNLDLNGTLTVDSALSSTSANPVQNKVVYNALSEKSPTNHTHTELARSEHTHSQYAVLNHLHIEYAESDHTHNEYANSDHTHSEYATSDHTHSEYANSGHTHSAATTSAAGFMSTSDKTKLNGIAEGASAVGEAWLNGAEAFNDYTQNNPTGKYSHAEGSYTDSTGDYSHAQGYDTLASGDYSHAGGYESIASGDYASFAHGYKATANGYTAVAFGESVTANMHQFVVGYCNSIMDGAGAGSQAGETIFCIGNGTNADNRSRAFAVTNNGKAYVADKTVSTGSDFAEYFEWADGNPKNENRLGKLVSLDGEKIKLANSEDDYILGVITGTGAFIGNSASENWQGKYLTDEYGEKILQDVEIPEKIDEVTGKVIPAYTVKQWVINPEYNPDQEYISRENRPEWDPVGMLGQVIVIDDGTCVVNGYCAPSIDGIGTAAESGYRVMKRIDDTHIKVLVR